jgi:hypothetical protein
VTTVENKILREEDMQRLDNQKDLLKDVEI